MSSFPHWDTLSFRKNPFPGKLIAIEGIDGAGKTTQAIELVKKLNMSGFTAAYSKEPTEDIIGQFIREKILSGHMKISPLALQYLFNADRVMHMEKIEKLLAKGMTIVMDRYFWSSVAYAMSDLDKPQDWYYTAFSILSFYHQFLVPDATFFLQIPNSVALSRIQTSKKHGEIYDNGESLVKIEKNYQKLMQEFPNEFHILNAEKSKEEVTHDLFENVVKIL